MQFKCISVRQPWAWLIVNGFKDIENRSRVFGYRGHILIHAGKKWHDRYDPKNPEVFQKEISAINPEIIIPQPEDLQRGGIVGITRITDCVSKSDSPWYEGPHGLVLKDSRSVKFIEFPGKLGVFDVVIQGGRGGFRRLFNDQTI